MQNKKTVTLGKYDPEYKHLTVTAGVNFKGKCTNNNCKANYQSDLSWVRKGFGEFDMHLARFSNRCQSCDQPINPKSIKTLGITRAKMTITGKVEKNDDYEDYRN